MLVLMGLGNAGSPPTTPANAFLTNWRDAPLQPRAVDSYGHHMGHYYYNGLPEKPGGYVYTYNAQRGAVPGGGAAAVPLRVLPVTGIGNYRATGMRGMGTTPPPPPPLPTTRTSDNAPNHRLRVKFQGPQRTVPITADQQSAAAGDLEAGSSGKLKVFYGPMSPVLTANMPVGYREGQPLNYWYEVDVWLAPGVDPAGAARSVERIINEKQRFFGAGLELVSAVFDAVGSTVSAAAAAAGKVVTNLFKSVWMPLLVIGGGFLVVKYGVPALIERRAAQSTISPAT